MKKFKLPGLILIASGLICSFLLCSCRKEEKSTSKSGKIKVAVTIFPLADIVKNIGLDKVDVITIMPPGASPHTFEISPKIVEQAMDANMLFKIGAGLDNWVEGVTGAMEEKPQVVDVSKVIDLRKLPDGSADPHYLSRPLARAASTSFALAASSSAVSFCSEEAISVSARFLVAVSASAIRREAARAVLPTPCMYSLTFIMMLDVF